MPLLMLFFFFFSSFICFFLRHYASIAFSLCHYACLFSPMLSSPPIFFVLPSSRFLLSQYFLLRAIFHGESAMLRVMCARDITLFCLYAFISSLRHISFSLYFSSYAAALMPSSFRRHIFTPVILASFSPHAIAICCFTCLPYALAAHSEGARYAALPCASARKSVAAVSFITLIADFSSLMPPEVSPLIMLMPLMNICYAEAICRCCYD